MTRGTVTIVVVAVGIMGALLWVARPTDPGAALDPRGTGPTGTAAMVRMVERLGAQVTVAAEPSSPGDGTIVVLQDRLGPSTRQAIEQQVRSGARLVLFDPSSPLNPVPVTGQLITDVFGALGREPSCDLLEGVVERVESARWTVLDPGSGATVTCFPVSSGFGLVVVPLGDGEVVVTGAVDAVVNRSIDEAGHAELAAALLVPDGTGQVTVIWDRGPGAIGGDTGLLELLPVGVQRALWMLVAAAVVYALARARRLGRPIAERMPVRVPASELALAIGDLLGRHGHRQAAADRLRADLRHEVALALHVPPDTPADVLVELLVARSGLDLDAAGLRTALLDGPVGSDDALVAVTSALARVRRMVRRPTHVGSPTRTQEDGVVGHP